jgi:hypothetical protein
LSPENQFGPFNRIAQVKSIGATGTIAEYLAEARKLARPNVMSRALISAGRVAMSAATASTQTHNLILGATLIAAATIQTAAANDRRHVRKAQPVPAPITQSVRDSNAALSPSQSTEPDWSRYSNGAMSAPAGR